MYVVNWVFARRETDYLASDVLPSPVQHFWSLAVEEQFYVIWPLLLIRARARGAASEPTGRRPGPRGPGGVVVRVVGVVLAHLAPAGVLHHDDPGLGARHRGAARRRPRRPAEARDPGPRLGRPGLGRARRAGRRRALAPAGHRLAGCVGAAADAADRGAALGRAGRGRRAARSRVLGTAPMVWVGGLLVLDLPLALAGHHPGRLDRRGVRRDHPGLGAGRAGARLGRARVAVVALRRVPDPPRAVAARPASGPARRRARPVLRRRARGPAAVRAPLTVHHDAARRHPPAAVPARRGDAAAGPAVHPRGRPRLGHPGPARRRNGPARRRRRPLPGARSGHGTGRLHLRRPAGQHHRRAGRGLQGDAVASGARGGGDDAGLADRHLRQVVVRLRRRPRGPGGCGLPRVRRVERGRSWTRCAPTRPTSSSPPASRRAPGPAAAPPPRPLVEGYASRWTQPGGCRGAGRRRRRQPGLTRRPRRLCRPAPERADPLLLRHGIRGRRERSGGAARRGGRGIRDGRRRAPARPHRA